MLNTQLSRTLEFKTIPGVVRKCREIDPDTAINESMLSELVRNGKLSCEQRGTRIVLDFSLAVSQICDMLMLYDLISFPRIRTVRDAATELVKAGTGINERIIRSFIRSDSLRTITVGNRHYIALQSFERPYASRLFGNLRDDRTKRFTFRNTADEQIEAIRMQQDSIQGIQRRVIKREKA